MQPLNPLPRRTLQALIKQHGPTLGADPRRCKAFLSDECGAYKLEVNLLTVALDERVPADLINTAHGTPLAMVLTQLTRRLVEQRGLTSDLARWAVDSWALALSIATEAELKAIPHSTLETPSAHVSSEPAAKPAAAPLRPMRPAPPPAPVPSRRVTASDWISLGFRTVLLLVPWLIQAYSVTGQVLGMWFELLRTLTETRPAHLRRAFEVGVLGAGAGAVVWGLIGAGVGLGIEVWRVVSFNQGLESIVWLQVLISATTGALPGMLLGALSTIIRRVGEFGGTLTGGLVGLLIGGVFSPMADMGFTTGALVGATISVLCAFVSLGMLSGKRKDYLGFMWETLGMAGRHLCKLSGWLQLLQGALIGGSGGAATWALISLGSSLSGTGTALLVGALVGWIAGAVVGNQYRMLKFL